MTKDDDRTDRDEDPPEPAEPEPQTHDHADDFDPGSPAADAPAVF